MRILVVRRSNQMVETTPVRWGQSPVNMEDIPGTEAAGMVVKTRGRWTYACVF